MKAFWLDARKFDKKLVTTAIESGADAILVPKGYSKKVKELGVVKTVAEDGDLRLGRDVFEVEINNKEDEARAAKLAGAKTVIVKTKNWRIIPLENLVAQCDKVIAFVRDSKEADIALKTLEKGVSGVLLATPNLNEIKDTAKNVKAQAEKLELVQAKIRRVTPLGMGDRVCVDTCTSMHVGQGMLVGDSSRGMFLVHSESVENPYVEQRPFRVNAGGVHAYIRVLEGKTRYLSELKTGASVLVVDYRGNAEPAVVGRSKTEKRPMMLVEASYGKTPVTLVMQNAETIRLVRPSGKPISIVKLKRGDFVLAYVEGAGRHFGMKVRETITEK
jgi:3-dehydroquinate synthase II